MDVSVTQQNIQIKLVVTSLVVISDLPVVALPLAEEAAHLQTTLFVKYVANLGDLIFP